LDVTTFGLAEHPMVIQQHDQSSMFIDRNI
jgi:hypothetical protein